VTPSLLEQLQSLTPSDDKILCFRARRGDENLGSILIARYEKNCEYLVGVTSEAGRQSNVGQFLLWQAVCQMKHRGYRWLDLGGMEPERTPPGILRFKSGLGGEPYRLCPEIEAFKGDWRSRLVRLAVQHVLRTTRRGRRADT